MNYLDTNAILYITCKHSEGLYMDAIQKLEEAPDRSVRVDSTVLTEAFFMMPLIRKDFTRADSVQAVRLLLDHPAVSKDATIQAILDLYETNLKLDFVDCYLIMTSNGKVITFDKALKRYIRNNF
jgi:predicted nucleic acid-binding protein